jgi:tetratricopeptide (TPR) repeat protein
MTVGLPGAGIGGLFYLASALWMPVHSVLRRVRGGLTLTERRPDTGGVVARQFGIAIAIIAALWTTGWLIGVVVIAHPKSLGALGPAVASKGIPNVLGMAALYVSIATLATALGSVQVARLLVSPRFSWRRQAAAAAAGSLVILFAPRVLAQDSAKSISGGHLAAGESAYAAGDAATAQREYALVLADNPRSGRALFRLGQLSRNDSRRAEDYFRRYLKLEPADAWGHMALGDALARNGSYRDAIAEYDRALAIVPDDRDANVGRARILIRAGRTDEAIASLVKWTANHSDDPEALRLLGDQRRRAGHFRAAATAYQRSMSAGERDAAGTARLRAVRSSAAPSVGVSTSGSTDSDQNRSLRAMALAGATIADGVRAEVYAGRKRITGFSEVTVTDGGAALTVRPNAAWQLETAVGAMHPVEASSVSIAADQMQPPISGPRLSAMVPGGGNGRGRGRGSGGGSDTSNVGQLPPGTIVNPNLVRNVTYLVGSARARWRQPGGLGLVDFRATRSALDANTVLLINRVVRSELAGRADIPLTSRLRARTGARVARYDAVDETNNRTAILAGLAYSATRTIEVSTIVQRLAFSHSTTSGYFAPRLAQLAEAGWYAEFENESGTVLALDGGGGVQRQAGFGEETGQWKPAFRLYALLTIPLGTSGNELRVDVDSYDSRLGSEAATSSSWRYASASASIRFALR